MSENAEGPVADGAATEPLEHVRLEERTGSEPTANAPKKPVAAKRKGGPRKNRYSADEFEEMAGQVKSKNPKEYAISVHRARELVLADENLTRADFVLFERLLQHMNRTKDGYAYVKVETLAGGNGKRFKPTMSARNVSYATKRLEDAGHIAQQRLRKWGNQATTRTYFPTIAYGTNGIRQTSPDCKSDCTPDCNAEQSAHRKSLQSADCIQLQSQEELAPEENLSVIEQGQKIKAPPHAEGGGVRADVVLSLDDRQREPAPPKANPFADCHDLIPGDTVMEPLWQAQMRTAGKIPAYLSGKRLPFSPKSIALCRRMRIDLEKLIERYFEKTEGKRIKNPSGYLVRMACEEVAKRDGIPLDQAEAMYSEDRATREKAQALALGLEPPKPALGAAKTSGAALMDALSRFEQSMKSRSGDRG